MRINLIPSGAENLASTAFSTTENASGNDFASMLLSRMGGGSTGPTPSGHAAELEKCPTVTALPPAPQTNALESGIICSPASETESGYNGELVLRVSDMAAVETNGEPVVLNAEFPCVEGNVPSVIRLIPIESGETQTGATVEVLVQVTD